MRQLALKTFAAVAVLFAIISSYFFTLRMRMPFNSEGNYFDSETATTYRDESVLVYGLITLVLIILAITGYIGLQKYRKT